MRRFLPTMKRAAAMVTVLLAWLPVLMAQPQFRDAGAILVSEETVNGSIESGERIRVGLSLKNVGDQIASNVVATIQTGNGISLPSPPSTNYGTLAPGAASVRCDFSFTVDAPPGSLLEVKLDIEDSNQSFGTVTYRFRVGPQVVEGSTFLSVVINSGGTAAPYPSVITVTNAAGAISDVSVTLSNLSHTFPDDLDILLVSPAGDSVMLMSDAMGSVDLLNLSLTFTGTATEFLPDLGFPSSNMVLPTNHPVEDSMPFPAPSGPYAGVMSAFNGKSAVGDWKLFVYDDAAGDSGAIAGGWSLAITTLTPVDPAPILTFLGATTNNMIRFAVSGRPGHNYAVESAPDPLQSFPLATFTMPLSGTRIFEYPLETTNRFFRAATDP